MDRGLRECTPTPALGHQSDRRSGRSTLWKGRSHPPEVPAVLIRAERWTEERRESPHAEVRPEDCSESIVRSTPLPFLIPYRLRIVTLKREDDAHRTRGHRTRGRNARKISDRSPRCTTTRLREIAECVITAGELAEKCKWSNLNSKSIGQSRLSYVTLVSPPRGFSSVIGRSVHWSRPIVHVLVGISILTNHVQKGKRPRCPQRLR